jgi:uncharacterized protein (UPF0332 family)
MFAPVSFYQLASDLHAASSGDDAQRRSAVSRAYYAAFLVARDAKGISSQGPDSHKRVIDAYMAGNQEDISIGNRLATLKQKRVKADYFVHETCSQRDSGSALQTAQKILIDLGALPDPSLDTTAPTTT